MKDFIKTFRSEISTIFGAVVAIATAWQAIDWDNFQLNAATIVKLLLSATIALGGYFTSINIKQ